MAAVELISAAYTLYLHPVAPSLAVALFFLLCLLNFRSILEAPGRRVNILYTHLKHTRGNKCSRLIDSDLRFFFRPIAGCPFGFLHHESLCQAGDQEAFISVAC